MRRISNLLGLGWNMLFHNDLARSSAIVLAIRAVNVFSAIALSIVLIRALGLKGYGFYAVYMSTFSLAVLPVTAGMPNFIVKEVAPRFAERNGSEIKGVMAFYLRVTSIYMILVALALGGLWLLNVGPQYGAYAILMWFHIAIQILNAGRSALLRAIGRIVKGQLAERFVQPGLSLVLTAAGWIAFGAGFSALHAIAALLLANVIALALGGYWIRQELGHLLSNAKASKAHDDWLKTVVSLSGVGLFNSAFVNGVVLIVGWAGSLETAALYRIAAAVAVVLNYLQEVMIQVVAPRVAQLWAARDRAGLSRILMIGALLNSSTIGLGTLALVFVGGDVLAMAYGPAYREANGALIILSLGTLAYALGGYRDLLLNMAGYAREAFKVSAVLVPICLMLSAVGVREFGQTGAAAAVLVFQVAATVWLTVATRKITGIDPSILGLFSNRRELPGRNALVGQAEG